jgi:hypothetical protein
MSLDESTQLITVDVPIVANEAWSAACRDFNAVCDKIHCSVPQSWNGIGATAYVENLSEIVQALRLRQQACWEANTQANIHRQLANEVPQ